MIVPDVNLLLYAHNESATHHERARDWWRDTLNGSHSVGLPWVAVLGFLRLATHRKAMPHPLGVGDAMRQVRKWLDRPHVEILHPGDRHADILFGLLEHVGVGGDLTTDAHLAALAIEYQAELHSTDVDFARFPGLRWRNPLK